MGYMAKKTEVPVCVHLDHGETLDYLKKALEGTWLLGYIKNLMCLPTTF